MWGGEATWGRVFPSSSRYLVKIIQYKLVQFGKHSVLNLSSKSFYASFIGI